MIPFLRDLVLKDRWLKLFSLVVAILIWLTVWFAINRGASPLPSPLPNLSLTPPETRPFAKLPVTILSSTGDVGGYKINPPEVDVTLQGDPKILRTLQTNDIRVLVDVTGLAPAPDVRKRVEVSTPPGVAHVRVDPPLVQVICPPKG